MFLPVYKTFATFFELGGIICVFRYSREISGAHGNFLEYFSVMNFRKTWVSLSRNGCMACPLSNLGCLASLDALRACVDCFYEVGRWGSKNSA